MNVSEDSKECACITALSSDQMNVLKCVAIGVFATFTSRFLLWFALCRAFHWCRTRIKKERGDSPINGHLTRTYLFLFGLSMVVFGEFLEAWSAGWPEWRADNRTFGRVVGCLLVMPVEQLAFHRIRAGRIFFPKSKKEEGANVNVAV